VELTGNLGRGVMKVSAVAPERHVIEAPAAVFHDQASVKEAFRAGRFNRDVIVVVRFQGPRANGMPELHALTPILAVLQDRGHKVALVTDGRMSGASGKVPSAIHVAPEALDGGLIGKLTDGDLIRVDATTGTLAVLTEGVRTAPPPPPISPAMAGAWAASSSRSSATAPDRPPPARPPSLTHRCNTAPIPFIFLQIRTPKAIAQPRPLWPRLRAPPTRGPLP
jgi:dihydroxyacid dehydratase/phosphogluconate dehydratase